MCKQMLFPPLVLGLSGPTVAQQSKVKEGRNHTGPKTSKNSSDPDLARRLIDADQFSLDGYIKRTLTLLLNRTGSPLRRKGLNFQVRTVSTAVRVSNG
jgi:hypothetical protein